LTIGNYYTGTGGTGTLLNAGDVLTSTQTLYVYAQTATTPNCTDEESFYVTVFNVDELPDVTSCQNYKLPALTIGKYYSSPGGTGTQLPVGSVISSSQTIYIYAQSPFTPTCFDESSFSVTIVPVPVANVVPANLRRICDEDGVNDGITTFDLTSLSATVLGTQTGPEFSIAYYATMDDANLGTNPIASTTLQTVYVRVSNSLAPSCYAIRTINITVNPLPIPTPVGGIICYDTFNEELISPYMIYSNLSSSTHQFEWTDANGVVVGTSSVFTAEQPGIYTVVATKISTGCTSVPVSVEVTPSEPALVSYTMTEDFSDNPVVTVVAEGTGDYEYQLDNGAFQDSPIFDNVSSGLHTITVRDKNQCGLSTTTALIINYPHYFTPNGDGIHDTWNIFDLQAQMASKIHIFDRYGKMLKQITPSGAGWDGTYGGQMMPSTDYWFVVQYVEDGIEKEFKAHFAMKR
jgi:gliding motility-associated-like protein